MGEERLFFIHVLLVMSVQETPSRPVAASVGILGHALLPFGERLRAEGFAVSEISDPNESGTFSLILVSLAHPDAVHWCERLCRRPSHPVVWAVADETNDEDVIRRALAAGVADVFGWPVSPAALVHRLRRHPAPPENRRQTRFQEFFQQNPLPCAIFDIGAETRPYVEVNPAFAAATGFSREELIGRSLEEIGNFARQESLVRMRERLARDRVFVFESEFRLKSGEIRRASVAVGLADIEGGKFALVTLYDLEKQMRKVEEARAETERRLVDLTRIVPGVVVEYRVEADGREVFTYVTEAIEGILGISSAAALADAQSVWARVHPDDADWVQASIVDARARFSSWQEEFRVITTDGQSRRVLATATPRREESATVWAGIFTDVTEQRRIERELEESHRKLEEVTTAMPAAVFRFARHPDGAEGFLFVTRGLEKFFKVPVQSFQEDPRNAWGVVHPDDLARVRACLDHSAATLAPWECEYRLNLPADEEQWIQGSATPHRESDGTVIWDGFFTNVTEQNRIKRELAESDRKLKEITTAMPGAVYRYAIRPDGTDAFLFFSEGLDELFGIPAQTLIDDASNAWALVHPDDLPRVKESSAISALELKPWECEYRLNLPDGSVRWIQGRSTPRREPDGTMVWDGFFSDISERKRIEAERNAAQETLATVTNAVPGAFYQYARRPDGSEGFPFFTSGLDDVLGFPAARIVENIRAYVTIIHPEDVARVRAVSAHSSATLAAWDLEYRIVPRPGEVRWVHGRSKPRHEPDGTIIWDGFLSDVTERKRIEAERNSAQQKLAEITAGMPGAVFQYHQSPAGDRSIPFVSEGVERLFGVSATEIMANGQTLWRYCDLEELQEAFRVTEHSSETLDPFDFTYRVALSDGIKWVRAQSVPHRTPDGGTVWSGLLSDVTEQKLTELARAEAERKLTEIAAAMPGAVYQYLKTPGGHYRFTFVSEGAAVLFGIPSPVSIEDMNRTFQGGLSPELLAEAFRLIDLSAEMLTPYQHEFPILLQDGSMKWIRAESLPRRLPNGGVQWSGFILDISERKRAEAARVEAETKLGEITAAMPGAVYQYVKTPGGHYRFTFVSEGGAALLGVPSPVRVEDVNRIFQERITPELSEAAFRLIDRSAEMLMPCLQEFPLSMPDGTTKWIRAESLPRRLPNGGVQWSGLIFDISERKLAEAARAEAEAKLGEIADAVPGAVYQYARYPDGRERFEFVSNGVEATIGVSAEALKADPARLFERIHPEDLPVSLAETLRVERELDGFDLEYRVRDDSGPNGWKWVRVQAVTHRRADGATVWTGLMTDIGDYKTLEASLRASEERFATIFRSSPVACVVTRLGDEGRIAAVNQAFTRLFGLDVEAVIGRTSIELGLTKDFVKRDAMREAVLAGLTPSVAESEMRASGGEMRKLLFAAERVVYDGEVCALTMIVDLTDRIRLENERLRADKLESLGVMAGGIAHDFNNLLTAMSGNAGLARRYLTNGAAPTRIQEKIESLERAVERAKTLSNQLLTFAKGGDPVRRTVDPIVFVVDPVRFVLTPTATTCRFDAPSGLWRVNADVGQMSQVFQNLAINATEAMSGGGTVEVAIENVWVEPSFPLPLPPGKYVRVVFADTGCGIPADRLAKIFDPYFTTKPTGTGLGLAVAHSVVMKHDGYITAQSEVGRGSRFEIYLPAQETGSLTRDVPALTPDDTRRAAERRILIMDDEELVREMMAAMVEDLGYPCVACRNGEEAIAEYRAAFEQGTPFALVMLDLKIMGGMGGLETFEHLRRIDPAVTAIVCSGYFSDPVLAHHREHGFAAKLQKPYRLDDLRVLLEKIFGER